eukprot:jgi/Mesvir1/18850/Mv03450-RA.1
MRPKKSAIHEGVRALHRLAQKAMDAPEDTPQQRRQKARALSELLVPMMRVHQARTGSLFDDLDYYPPYVHAGYGAGQASQQTSEKRNKVYDAVRFARTHAEKVEIDDPLRIYLDNRVRRVIDEIPSRAKGDLYKSAPADLKHLFGEMKTPLTTNLVFNDGESTPAPGSTRTNGLFEKELTQYPVQRTLFDSPPTQPPQPANTTPAKNPAQTTAAAAAWSPPPPPPGGSSGASAPPPPTPPPEKTTTPPSAQKPPRSAQKPAPQSAKKTATPVRIKPTPTTDEQLDALKTQGMATTEMLKEKIQQRADEGKGVGLDRPTWDQKQANEVQRLLHLMPQGTTIEYNRLTHANQRGQGIQAAILKNDTAPHRTRGGFGRTTGFGQYRVPYPRFDNFPYEVLPSLHWYDVDG